MAICDMKCFACKFSDCINDSISTEEKRKANARDKEFSGLKTDKKQLERSAKHREENKEYYANYQRERYHSDEEFRNKNIAKASNWYAENKERQMEMQRKRRAEKKLK